MMILPLINTLYSVADGANDDDPPAEVVPKGKFDEVVRQRDKQKAELKELRDAKSQMEAQLSELQDSVLSEEDRAIFEEWKTQRESGKDTRDLISKTEAAKAREKERLKYQQELDTAKAEAQATIDQLNQEIDRLTIDTHLELATVEAGVQRTDEMDLVSQVVNLLKPSLKREPLEDGGYQVVCVDKEGETVYSNGVPMSISERVASFLKANTHFLPNRQGVGPRIPSRMSGGRGQKDYWQESPLDNLEHLYKEK